VTFQLIHRWCQRCAAITAHEVNETGALRCAPCADKQRGPTCPKYETGTLRQHISALDGAGNRGELPQKRRGKQT
jgi:hypothetical protein